MKSIFLNRVCSLGDLKDSFHHNSVNELTTFTYGGSDAVDSCSHCEFSNSGLEARQLLHRKLVIKGNYVVLVLVEEEAGL